MSEIEDRREKWDEGTLKAVRGLYAMVMGTIIVLAAAFQVFPHLLEDGLTTVEALFGFGVLVVGVVASMPWIFLGLAGEMIEAVRARFGGDG